MGNVWEEYFGKGWDTLSGSIENAGAFLVDLKAGEYKADKNALALMGLKEDTGFDDLVSFVKMLRDRLDVMLPVRLKTIVDDDSYIIGIVYVDNVFSGRVDPKLAVIDQAKLMRIMAGSIGEPLLFLMQIEGMGNPSLQDVYVYSALKAVREHVPYNTLIAYNSPLRFWVCIPEYNEGDEIIYLQNIKNAVEECELVDEYGFVISKHHNMTITAGTTGGNLYPAERMHVATAALYKALRKGRGNLVAYTADSVDYPNEGESEFNLIRKFNRLIEYNLFLYHFQPIVSARTGKVLAYEMLMRTDASIGLNPGQILDAAQKSDRLYDVEFATMYNGYRILAENSEIFKDKKLYINSISGYYLRDEDYDPLVEKYGHIMDCSVIEFTEQTEFSGDRFGQIRKRLKDNGIELAIDDYGTGYSNTTNLLKYNPLVVKIDRELISGIENNNKMMNIVGNIIEFLHNNSYLALAEGVETYEELKTMIGLGADYIQGFYIARPAPEFLEAVDDEIVEQIVRINTENGGSITKMYNPAEGEILYVDELVTANYTSVMVDVKEVTLRGSGGDIIMPLTITVKDDLKTTIILENVKISSSTAMGVLRLGRGSEVELMCKGDNIFDRKGILVPTESSIRFTGTGCLDINSEAMNCFGIGNESRYSHGDVTIDMSGCVNIRCNGDSCIGIGAGRNTEGKKIRLLKGCVSVDNAGGRCVGIGTTEGGADIEVLNCQVAVKNSAATSIGIGSLKGSANINLSNFQYTLSSTGTVQACLGVLEAGTGLIKIKHGVTRSVMRGERIMNIGTCGGNLSISVAHASIDIYCEGNSASGIGDEHGTGDITIDESELKIHIVSSYAYALGTGGNISINEVKKDIIINE